MGKATVADSPDHRVITPALFPLFGARFDILKPSGRENVQAIVLFSDFQRYIGS